jgi:hypothetical protein
VVLVSLYFYFSLFYIFCTNFFFFPEYKETAIDYIKSKAITDAYLRMFKILYQCGKVKPFIFRQKIENPGPKLNCTNCTTAANGKFLKFYFIKIRN